MANNIKTPLIRLVFSLICLTSGAEAQIQTFVQTGDPAADTGTTFNRFGLPALNNAGQVVYFSSLTGVSPTDLGIYRSLISTPGADQVVRAGDAAPGGGVYIEFTDPAITSSGQTNFGNSTEEHSENGIFGVSSTGVASRFIATGSTSPDGDGVLDGPPHLAAVSYNNNSQAAFYDTLSGTSNGRSDDEGVFRTGTSPGSLVQIVREGDPVPDGNGSFGVSLADPYSAFGDPSLNNAGTVAFFAGVIGSTSSFDAGIFTGNGGDIVQIARAGQTGIAANGAFVSFLSAPAINNNNQVAFVASSRLGTVLNDAIYRKDAGTLTEIAHAGEALPGGGFIEDVSDAVQINDAGQVASLIQTNTSSLPNIGSGGIIRGSGGLLTVIARNGESTPRGGATIMSSFSSQVFAMNALGDVAFTALLDTNPNDVVSNDSKGLFLYGDRFGLLEIAQEGDSLNGSTITDLSLAGTGAVSGVSPLQMGLNDEDQVAFRFDLANGKEGISVWSIPEPGPIFLIILGGFCLVFLGSGQQMLSFASKRWH